MKILLTRNANIYGHGGAEEFLLNLATELKKSNYKVIVATALPKLSQKAKSLGIKTIKCPWLTNQSWHGSKQLLIPFYFAWIIRLTIWYLLTIRKERPDILHPQNRDDWIAASIAGRIMGKCVIWSDHADLKHEVKNINIWYKNWQGKLVLFASNFVCAITVVSQADLSEINESLNGKLNSKITVIHNGVFDLFLKTKPVNKPKNKIIMGTTSRLMRQKGLFELLDAYKNLVLSYPNLELWLIGDGTDASKLKIQAKNYSGIKFYGHVNNPLDYATVFDIFIHPSYTEGFSLSIVEAAMLGLPIIATRVGGNVEIIEDNRTGLLVNTHSYKELEDAVIKLLNSPELSAKLGENARQTFLKEFEFSKIVKDKFIPLYNKAR